MSVRPLLVFLMLLVAAACPARPVHCFQRGYSIYTARLDGSGAKRIARGLAPEVSPDGTRVVFHRETSSDKGRKVTRHLVVKDLVTGREHTWTHLPSDLATDGRWSPDGSRLLFTIWIQDEPCAAVARADGTDLQLLGKVNPLPVGWNASGDGVFDIKNGVFREFDLTRKRMRSVGRLDGEGTAQISPDGSAVWFSRRMTPFDPAGLWRMSLRDGKSHLVISDKNFSWHQPWPLGENTGLAVRRNGPGVAEQPPALYLISASGAPPRLLVRDAFNPSASR